MSPALSIVVPLWNESPNIIPLTQQIFLAFRREPRQIELILVDDASTDDTWERILEARKEDSRIHPLRHITHSGQSAALWTGFRASRAEVIATLDGDLQNDPSDLPRMFATLPGCDMVCGVRTKRRDSTLRRFSSTVAWLAQRTVLGAGFRDTGCALRVFRRWVLETIPAFNGFHRFMPILAATAGAIVVEVEVGHFPRTAGYSKYGLWNRLGRGVCDLTIMVWYLKRQLKRVATMEPAETSHNLDDPRS